ncbi:uncharacterized protein LOC135467837 [Liolophura sinensis]|uniref:uncharacterized protein LOC135467837 n=1 Tax=Liolophura sinensis TaxID=3198878 RepID=UPI0031595AD3
MLAQAMEMSLHVRDKSARDRYKTGYHAGEAALTPCQWVLSDIGYHLVHNSLNQDFPSVPDNYQLNSSYDDLPEGAFGESKPCPSYADRLTAEWRPRSQPINCDPTSAVPHVNQVNKECRTAEGIRNTVVDFNSTNSHKSVETGQSHSSHSDMNQIDVTPTTSDCKLLSQMEPHLNRDPHSFSHHSLGSWEVPISKTDNTDWSCTTVNSHKKPPQLPHAPGIVLERGIPDQTLDTVQPSNSSFFRPEEREWSKTCESWDTTDTENVRFPLEMSQSEQPEDGWSKMDQTDVLMQFHSKDTSGDGSNTPNNNPPAMGSTCLSTSPEEKFLSNNQNEEQTDQFDTPIPTVRTNANFGVNDRTDQQLPSHSEASLGNTNTQSSPAAFSFRHLKINAIRKPNDSNSAAQPNSGTEVRNNSVSAPFVLPPAHEDWGTELIEDILVIADDLQRKERESDTVYIPSSENVDRKPEQDQGIITPNANVPNHSQIALDPQERPTENSTPENLERRDLEAMNERIQSTSQLWVNEVDNSVDESGDHDGPGGNSSSEFFPPRAHRKIDHFPGLPSVLPDDLNIYMQYLAQNAAMAMMSNPLMMPLGASVPSFPALGHVPILGIPGMMPMMPNSHLWQHAMQLQFQQQQELLRQQMLHRQNGMQRTAGMGPLVEEETQREQAPHSLIAADKSRPDRSPGHQRAHVDHQDQQLMNDKGFPAETLIPENTASSPQESTYSLRLPKSNRPSFKIRVAFPAGERSQPSQSPPAGMDGSEHLIASQDSVSRDSVSHSNTAGVRLASVHDSSTQSESFTKRPGSGVRFPSRGRGHALSRRYQTSHSDRSNTSYNVVSTSAASGITQYRPQGGISSLKYKFPNDNNCSSDRSSGYQYKSQNTMNGTQDKDEDNPRYHRSVGNVSESQHRLLSDTSKANILSCKESWDAELLNVDVTIHGQPRQKYEQGHCPPQKVPSKGRGIRNSLAKITADNRGHSLGRQVIVKEEISDSDRRNY